MFDFIKELFLNYVKEAPYTSVVVALLLAAIGIPLPEDIPLLFGGYMVGEKDNINFHMMSITTGIGIPLPKNGPQLMELGGYVFQGKGNPSIHPNLFIMMAYGIGAILLGDSLIFWIGKKCHKWISKHPKLQRFVEGENFILAQNVIKHTGGKTIMVARFLPGLRSPVFLAAGSLGMPFRTFILCDGLACLFSAPIFILLGWYFHQDFDNLIVWIEHNKIYGGIVVVIALALLITWKILIIKKIKRMARNQVEQDAKDTEPPTPE